MVGARKVGLAQCTPRSPSTLGLFHRYGESGNFLDKRLQRQNSSCLFLDCKITDTQCGRW